MDPREEEEEARLGLAKATGGRDGLGSFRLVWTGLDWSRLCLLVSFMTGREGTGNEPNPNQRPLFFSLYFSSRYTPLQ